ncbi:MAG: RAD55 family ATPase [Candidatus Hermodarchaeia archaeon]|jgi:circadian clock protein KaiC
MLRDKTRNKVKWEFSPRERVPTGVKGLDNMLGGGLPSGTCILVLGGPGAGKTIFGIQFLYTGAVEYNEAGLYVSFDESPPYLRKNMESFGWNLKRLEKEERFFILDLSPIRAFPREIEASFVKMNLMETIRNKVQEIQPRRIVIDSLAPLVVQFPNVVERQNTVIKLFQTVMDLGATGLMLNELQTTYRGRELQVEEFLAHGVIIFRTLEERMKILKAIQIEKMRGVSHDSQLRPYTIDENGLKVFSKENIFVPASSIHTKK